MVSLRGGGEGHLPLCSQGSGDPAAVGHPRGLGDPGASCWWLRPPRVCFIQGAV